MSATQLDALYPTHAAYVHAVDKATSAAVEGRWITKADAKAIEAAAKRSQIGTGQCGAHSAQPRAPW